MISVIVPTVGNMRNLLRCLESLKKQSFKQKEIIIVADKINNELQKAAKKYKAKLIVDEKSTLGSAYHTGIKHSRGDIIAFIDDDAYAPKDWLAKISGEFKEKIDAFGGEDLLPPNSSKFQQACYQIDLARMEKEPFYGERAFRRLRAVNIAYRRKIFNRNSFNTSLISLQEPELHHRLIKEGLTAKFNPKIAVYHDRRKDVRSLFRQMYRNGKAKMQLIKLHGSETLSFEDIVSVAVPFLTLYFIFAHFSYSSRPLVTWIALLALYYIVKPFYILSKTSKLNLYPQMFKAVLSREIGYSLGILAGLKEFFKR